MNNLKPSERSEFRIWDFFYVQRWSLPPLWTLKDGDCPIITASWYNQGIWKYGEVSPLYENKITVSMNGEGAGSTFFHDYPFVVNPDCCVLIEKFNISKRIGFFLASIINSFSYNHDFSTKLTNKLLEDGIIKLPASASWEPDREFMEKYMQEIEDKVQKSVALLTQISQKENKEVMWVSEWVSEDKDLSGNSFISTISLI